MPHTVFKLYYNGNIYYLGNHFPPTFLHFHGNNHMNIIETNYENKTKYMHAVSFS